MKQVTKIILTYGMVFLSVLMLLVIACVHSGEYSFASSLIKWLSWIGLVMSAITVLEAAGGERGVFVLLFRGSLLVFFLSGIVPSISHVLFLIGGVALLISVGNACYWLAKHDRDAVVRAQQ